MTEATADTALSTEDGAEGTSPRRMRADARLNNERLLAAARRVFTRDGGSASMEAIAKEAGVGVGTLYRHFPRRIDLVEAVYRNDVDELIAGAEKSVNELEPWPALVAWLDSFISYSQTKRVLLSELQESFDKNPAFKLRSRERINAATAVALERAQRAGMARTDIDAADLMQLLGPMCIHAQLSSEQSRRLLAVVIDGLRPSPQ